jgi:hypothetical protein
LLDHSLAASSFCTVRSLTVIGWRDAGCSPLSPRYTQFPAWRPGHLGAAASGDTRRDHPAASGGSRPAAWAVTATPARPASGIAVALSGPTSRLDGGCLLYRLDRKQIALGPMPPARLTGRLSGCPLGDCSRQRQPQHHRGSWRCPSRRGVQGCQKGGTLAWVLAAFGRSLRVSHLR